MWKIQVFSPVYPGINAASHVQAPIIFCCCCWYHIVIPLKFKDIRDFITHIFDSTEQKNSVWPRKRETLFSIVRSKLIEYNEKGEREKDCTYLAFLTCCPNQNRVNICKKLTTKKYRAENETEIFFFRHLAPSNASFIARRARIHSWCSREHFRLWTLAWRIQHSLLFSLDSVRRSRVDIFFLLLATTHRESRVYTTTTTTAREKWEKFIYFIAWTLYTPIECRLDFTLTWWRQKKTSLFASPLSCRSQSQSHRSDVPIPYELTTYTAREIIAVDSLGYSENVRGAHEPTQNHKRQ